MSTNASANPPTIVRSMVFTSAHDPDRIMATATQGMDALCLDLEDLTPHDAKREARRIFPEMAAHLTARGIRVMARTNGLDNGMAEADLEAIVGPSLHCVNFPKTERPEQIVEFAALLDRVEADKGLPVGHTLVRPIIETARGVRAAYEVAASSPRVAYMGGVEGGWWGDLGSSIGYLSTPTAQETLFVRSKVLVDVRAADVPYPIGGGSIGSNEAADVEAFFRECRVLGYTGVHCAYSADAVRLANEIFAPSIADIEEWSQLLPHFEEAERAGLTSTWIGARHYDLVCLPRIRSQMELAGRLGLLPA